MAKIQIQNATVDRIIAGLGMAVSTSFTRKDGKPGKEKFTVWTDPSAYKVGDVISVTGNLSVKVEEFEGDNGTVRYAQVSVNNPRIEKSGEDAPF
jgi:chitodextrinase